MSVLLTTSYVTKSAVVAMPRPTRGGDSPKMTQFWPPVCTRQPLRCQGSAPPTAAQLEGMSGVFVS